GHAGSAGPESAEGRSGPGVLGLHHDLHGYRGLRVVPRIRHDFRPIPFGIECDAKVPLYTADALVLRTYKLGEADRIVVFLTRDRGKKRGVAQGARRPRSRFRGALEPLTEARVAYFEKEGRELVGLNYAETVRSPLASASLDALGYSQYFAELMD